MKKVNTAKDFANMPCAHLEIEQVLLSLCFYYQI